MAVDHDLKPHLDTWHSFVRMVFYGAAFVVVLLGLLALFLL
ncbi:MAG: aa3-type cytochrome c oxidase subunit IV [Alphaproteobacteria bacterium]